MITEILISTKSKLNRKIDCPTKKQSPRIFSFFLSFFININNTDSHSHLWLFLLKSFSNIRNKLVSSRKFEQKLPLFKPQNYSEIPWAKLLLGQQYLQTLAELCFLVLIWNGWQEALFSPFCKREGGTDICLQTVVCKHNCKLFWKNIGKHFGNKRNIICIFTLASKVFWKYFQVYASFYTQTLHNAYGSISFK